MWVPAVVRRVTSCYTLYFYLYWTSIFVQQRKDRIVHANFESTHTAMIPILKTMTMFMVLSSWLKATSSPSSFDECRLSARWSPTLRPSQTTWAASPPLGCYHPHPPSPFVSITQPQSWYSFHHSMEIQSLWVDLGTAVRVCNPCPRLHNHSGCRDKHNCQRWYSNLGPLTQQSYALPLDYCDK